MVKRDRDETGEVIDIEPVDRKELVKQSMDAKGRFLKGNKLGGRPKGARAKIEETFLRNALDAWRKHGEVALEKMAQEEAGNFCRMMASLLPRVKPQNEDDGLAAVNVNVNIQVSEFMTKLQAIAKRQAELKALDGPDEPEDEDEK
jgi:hypothetical protein